MRNKYILGGIIVLVLLFLALFFFPKKNTSGKTVIFTCADQKSITATFYPASDTHVDLKLSDGRNLAVPHAISGSGARYANQDESFVFWNKGDTAFVDENGTSTYQNCAILSTYSDNKYGFEISYPQELMPEKNFASYYHLPNFWRAEAGPASTGTNVLALPIFRIDQGGVATGKPYPLYFDAEVRIGVSSNPADVTDCLKPDASYTNQTVTDLTLNGINFKKFDFANAGMMQYVEGESYRTIHNNLCFALEKIKTGSSYRDPSMLPGIPDDILNSYYGQADQIIQTFRFL